MPVKFTQQVNNDLWLAVWEITEQENELISLSGKELLPDNVASIKSIHQRKQSISGRLLVRHLSEQVYESFSGITKNENGKPFLVAQSGQISISHSKEYAAAVLHTKSSTGVDIEVASNRILKVIKRVTSANEQLHIKNGKDATIFWCAKEALYKLYGKPGLDFAKQLQIEKETSHRYRGIISDGGNFTEVQLEMLELGNFVIVYAS